MAGSGSWWAGVHHDGRGGAHDGRRIQLAGEHPQGTLPGRPLPRLHKCGGRLAPRDVDAGCGQTSKMLYSTSDGGRTWQEDSCSLGPGCPQKDGLLPSDSYPTGISFLGSDGFASALNHGDPYLWFYESHDAGHTWQRILLTVPKTYAHGYGDVYPPSFSGTSGRMFVQFSTSTGPYLVVYQSADGGRSWQPKASLTLPVSLASPVQFGWTIGEDGDVFRDIGLARCGALRALQDSSDAMLFAVATVLIRAAGNQEHHLPGEVVAPTGIHVM